MRLIVTIVAVFVATLSAPQFEPVQPDLFGTGGTFSNAWADYDGDRDLDLFVGFGTGTNRLYRNDGGSFADAAAQAGVADARATRAAAWGDYDADGDADLLVGFTPGNSSLLKLYQNQDGRFSDVTAEVGLSVDSGAVRQLSWIDFDNDADLDLFVAFRDRANALFRNELGMARQFQNVATGLGLADTRKTVGAVWFDYDQDGDLDLFVANMDGDANGLYRNDRARFTDVAVSAGVAWGGRKEGDATNGTVRPCAEDVDNDGRIDLFLANYGTNGLFLNRGEGRFEDVSAAWGIAIDARYDSCAFADFDNDGRLDLYVNGTVTGGQNYRDYLFRNTGNKFEDQTPANIAALQADHGVQWADFDQDGDLDLALTGAQANGMHSLLRNQLAAEQARRSLQLLVLDGAGHGTRAGSEVRLFAAAGRRLLATRLMDTGSGYNSQNVAPVHFGLGDAAEVYVEITVLTGRGRRTAVIPSSALRQSAGQMLVIRVDNDGRMTIASRPS